MTTSTAYGAHSTSLLGLITEPEHADLIIGDGAADAVFPARVLLRKPAWIRQAADHLGHDLAHPVRYAQAFR